MSVDKVMRLTLACLAMASVWMCAAPAHAVWVTEWQLGRPGQGWAPPVAGLGGPDVTFVREQGASNPRPGNPNNPAIDNQGDDDYYFAGTYPGTITSGFSSQSQQVQS